MKKYIIFALALACILHIGIAGCQKTTSGSDIYAFPERTAQIKCTVYSQGAEKEFVLGSDEHNPHGLSVRNACYCMVLWAETDFLRQARRC